MKTVVNQGMVVCLKKTKKYQRFLFGTSHKTARDLLRLSEVSAAAVMFENQKEKGETMKSYRPTVPKLVARLRLKAEACRLACISGLRSQGGSPCL